MRSGHARPGDGPVARGRASAGIAVSIQAGADGYDAAAGRLDVDHCPPARVGRLCAPYVGSADRDRVH